LAKKSQYKIRNFSY